MERIGYLAKNIETEILYPYIFDEENNFYINYGGDHFIKEDPEEFIILEIFYKKAD